MSRQAPFTFYEFFAGGGMARIGLGSAWRCLFANDIDPGKASSYGANFGADHFRLADVWDLDCGDLPGCADLAWASSPCQDLSLAGSRQGLAGRRSSAFWGFWRLIEQLDEEGRAPRALGIENVLGLLSSHGGSDFTALCAALASRGYAMGALEIDAAQFLPQSRPRLFVLAARDPPEALRDPGPGAFHSPAVLKAYERLPAELKDRWIWWPVSEPPPRNTTLAEALGPDEAAEWLSPAQTDRLVSLMAGVHRRKLDQALAAGGRQVGAAFRRTRIENGQRTQRTEVRFDGLAGCLRTPAGGSSRQFVLVVQDGAVRARLLDGREAMRLMGLPEDYRLPAGATAALHLAGDGVACPVVRRLAEQVLEPLLRGTARAAA